MTVSSQFDVLGYIIPSPIWPSVSSSEFPWNREEHNSWWHHAKSALLMLPCHNVYWPWNPAGSFHKLWMVLCQKIFLSVWKGQIKKKKTSVKSLYWVGILGILSISEWKYSTAQNKTLFRKWQSVVTNTRPNQKKLFLKFKLIFCSNKLESVQKISPAWTFYTSHYLHVEVKYPSTFFN